MKYSVDGFIGGPYDGLEIPSLGLDPTLYGYMSRGTAYTADLEAQYESEQRGEEPGMVEVSDPRTFAIYQLIALQHTQHSIRRVYRFVEFVVNEKMKERLRELNGIDEPQG